MDGHAPLAASATPGRTPVSITTIELLHQELVSYLLKRHDDGRVASEELWTKLEQAGYAVGRRFAERCAPFSSPAPAPFLSFLLTPPPLHATASPSRAPRARARRRCSTW